MGTRHPSRRPAGRGVAFTADVVDRETRWGDTFPEDPDLRRHLLRRGDDRLGHPAFHARRPDRGAALAHAGTTEASEELTSFYTEAFGFDVPLWKQYLNFWAALFHGDLGLSITNFPTPVTELIMGALPYTLALLVPAVLLSFWAGNKVGALAARRKLLDNTVLPVGYVLTATPHLARNDPRWLFASTLAIFPVSGATGSRCSLSGRSSSREASCTTGSCRSPPCSSSLSAAGPSGCGT